MALYLQSKLCLQIQAIDNDVKLDPVERSKRKQNLLLLHNLSIGSPLGAAYMGTLESSATTPSSTVSSLMSPHAQSFYPPGDTVESVIGTCRRLPIIYLFASRKLLCCLYETRLTDDVYYIPVFSMENIDHKKQSFLC